MSAKVNDDDSLMVSWMDGFPRSMEKQLIDCHTIAFALFSVRPRRRHRMSNPPADHASATPPGVVWRSCVHRVFDQRAAARPDAVAVECGEQRWTYAEIAAASRSFAADLRRAGVRPGGIVGIGIGRSVEFVVAVLAVLRCGAAYAPLPCEDPGAHHEVILGANAATIANIVRGIRGDRAPQAGCPAESADRRQG
jgi:non-ribosomal peptide synthetase component F